MAFSLGLSQGQGRWHLLLGTKGRFQGATVIEIPPRARSSRSTGSSWFYIDAGNCPRWDCTVMSGESCVMVHSLPMPIRGLAIPEQAQECVQLIQKHLRLTADKAHLLFLISVGSGPVLMGTLLQNKWVYVRGWISNNALNQPLTQMPLHMTKNAFWSLHLTHLQNCLNVGTTQ